VQQAGHYYWMLQFNMLMEFNLSLIIMVNNASRVRDTGNAQDFDGRAPT